MQPWRNLSRQGWEDTQWHATSCHYESMKLLLPVTLAHTSDARAGKDWCYRERERDDNTWMFEEQSVQEVSPGEVLLLGELIWTVFIHVSLSLLSRVSPGSFGSGVHRAIALRHDADLRRDHLFDADFLRALSRQLKGQKQDPDRMNSFRVMRLMRQV